MKVATKVDQSVQHEGSVKHNNESINNCKTIKAIKGRKQVNLKIGFNSQDGQWLMV